MRCLSMYKGACASTAAARGGDRLVRRTNLLLSLVSSILLLLAMLWALSTLSVLDVLKSSVHALLEACPKPSVPGWQNNKSC